MLSPDPAFPLSPEEKGGRENWMWIRKNQNIIAKRCPKICVPAAHYIKMIQKQPPKLAEVRSKLPRKCMDCSFLLIWTKWKHVSYFLQALTETQLLFRTQEGSKIVCNTVLEHCQGFSSHSLLLPCFQSPDSPWEETLSLYWSHQ